MLSSDIILGLYVNHPVQLLLANGQLCHGEMTNYNSAAGTLCINGNTVNVSELEDIRYCGGVTPAFYKNSAEELAVDGRAALDILERDPAFDAVLSDMWMPVMDGSELVKRIRADERLAKLRVCSITADVEARATYREQGFDSLLLKPVTINKLAELFGG